MCDECTILRDHYPRDPEVRLAAGLRLFNPACLHCGARFIQWIQRMALQARDEKRDRCRAVLARWLTYGHDEQKLRELAKKPEWAVAPEKAKR